MNIYSFREHFNAINNLLDVKQTENHKLKRLSQHRIEFGQIDLEISKR